MFMALNFDAFLNAFPGNIAQGTIWGIMALGLFISYKLLNFSDLTVDGSFATGGCVTVILIISGVPAPIALFAAVISGMIAGFFTGILHTVFGIAPILSGILTQIALYSIDLHILGGKANQAVSVDKFALTVSLRNVDSAIIVTVVFAAVLIAGFYWFFGTEVGSAIRATGCNLNMSKAQGINTDAMKVLALSVSNGIVALSGGLMAQYNGFADVGSGRGAIVIGLAAIIIGGVLVEAVLRKRMNFAASLSSAVIGGIIYYIVIGLVIWLKLPTNDLKLFTAIIVAIFLAVPYLKGKAGSSFGAAGKRAKKEKGAKENA